MENTSLENMTEVDMKDISGVATSVQDAVETRHSVRDYLPTPIPTDIQEKLFAQALRSPSWKNSQPWKVHIVNGEKRNQLAEAMVSAAKSSAPMPDTIWPNGFPSEAKKRMFDLGMKIYGVAGIERKDKEARDAFMVRNFEFFGAPTGIFITTEFELNFYIALDIGCFLNTIMLLARSYGLGTVPQAALSAFPNVVRSHLGIEEKHKVVCGLSLGYPKPDSLLNRFHTPREENNSLIKFYE
nr:PnbA2 [uncultured bacterium]